MVDIATRSCDHFKHAKTALEAGKIVFLEKPMCLTYEDAVKLMELGEKNGERRLFIRHNRRFEAKFMQLNRIIIAEFEGINGRTVEIEISGGTAMSVPDYIVYGSRGSLLSKGDTYEIKYMPEDHKRPDKPADPHTPAGAKFASAPPIPFVTEEHPWETNRLDHTWVYLYEAVRNGADYPIKSEEALKVMQAICEIKRQNQPQ